VVLAWSDVREPRKVTVARKEKPAAAHSATPRVSHFVNSQSGMTRFIPGLILSGSLKIFLFASKIFMYSLAFP
jgi:hypothetical protein